MYLSENNTAQLHFTLRGGCDSFLTTHLTVTQCLIQKL